MSTTLTPAEAQRLLTNLSPGTKIEINRLCLIHQGKETTGERN